MRALREVSAITLASFPFAIIPNKLLQELRMLARDASLDLPLTEELAADIFMGRFSAKFYESASVAADLLGQSLYATYYRIDAKALRALKPLPEEPEQRRLFVGMRKADELTEHCRGRAGLNAGDRGIAINGMIIEQQQIVTTHNLAVLFERLGLAATLSAELPGMVRRCFEWICQRHQARYPDRHSRLIMLKNTAYAWRQMIFFLSMMAPESRVQSLAELHRHFEAQPERFRTRFAPALHGLDGQGDGRTFLGWAAKAHWLMPDESKRG